VGERGRPDADHPVARHGDSRKRDDRRRGHGRQPEPYRGGERRGRSWTATSRRWRGRGLAHRSDCGAAHQPGCARLGTPATSPPSRRYGIDVAAGVFHGASATATHNRRRGSRSAYPDGRRRLLIRHPFNQLFARPSTAFWQQAYLDMANIMSAAGLGSVPAIRGSPVVVQRVGGGHAIL